MTAKSVFNNLISHWHLEKTRRELVIENGHGLENVDLILSEKASFMTLARIAENSKNFIRGQKYDKNRGRAYDNQKSNNK